MNLHEYQAKQLFRAQGLPVSSGEIATSAQQAAEICRKLGGDRWVVKAQVHAGGRGKAGGVKLVGTPEAAADFAAQWLGKNLVTFQTDAKGQPVAAILVEACTDIADELYLSAVVDRKTQGVVVMASTEGGVDIEEVAAKTPEKIVRSAIDAAQGPMPWQARAMAKALGLDARQQREFAGIFMGLVRLVLERDLALVEVNPLVVTDEGRLHCLDAKVNVDDNALYRHKDIAGMRDPTQEDPREAQAAEHELSYVALDGDIGCMVNGAGLAMATMDLIQVYGGSPANFLDVGGRTTAERVAEAFKIVLSDSGVRAVLVNIFGGIVRCDFIAEGILKAVHEVGVEVPVVVRLEGNLAEEGLRMIQESGTEVIAAQGLEDAARKAVAAAGA